MHRTFRLRRYHRNTSMWCSAFFGGMTLGCIVASLLDAERGWLWLVMGAFWLAWLMLATYSLASYYVEELRVDGSRVVHHTLFSHRELLLDQSANLKWRIWPQHGSFVIRSPISRMAIDLGNFEPHERVAIVRYLRDALQTEQQTGWNEFCHRWALPLVGPEVEPDEKATVLLSRRQIDRIFAWMLLPNLVVTVVLIWLDGGKWWPSLFALAPWWLVMRFMIPLGGMRASRCNAVPGIRAWLACFVGLVSGMFVYALNQPLGTACWVVSAVAFIQFIRRANAEERRKLAQATEGAKTADARWRSAVGADLAG